MKNIIINFLTLFLSFIFFAIIFSFLGFLGLIIFFLIVSFLIEKYYKKEEIKEAVKVEKQEIFFNKEDEKKQDYTYFYNKNSDIKVTSILNKSELDFYKKLKSYLDGKDYFIFSKVRLADFINLSNIKNFSERTTIFNKISRKHIDFLITDYNSKILFLIELDGEFHNYDKKSIENDKFKNNLFNDLGIKLFRFRVNKNYNFSVLNSDIFLYTNEYLERFKKTV